MNPHEEALAGLVDSINYANELSKLPRDEFGNRVGLIQEYLNKVFSGGYIEDNNQRIHEIVNDAIERKDPQKLFDLIAGVGGITTFRRVIDKSGYGLYKQLFPLERNVVPEHYLKGKMQVITDDLQKGATFVDTPQEIIDAYSDVYKNPIDRLVHAYTEDRIQPRDLRLTVKTKDLMKYREYKRKEIRGSTGQRSTEEMEDLRKSIRKNGIQNPIELYIQRNTRLASGIGSKPNPNIVEAMVGEGNHRLRIAYEEGIKEVPIYLRYNGLYGFVQPKEIKLYGSGNHWSEENTGGIGEVFKPQKTLSPADHFRNYQKADEMEKEFSKFLKDHYPSVSLRNTTLDDMINNGYYDPLPLTMPDIEFLKSKGYDSIRFQGGSWTILDNIRRLTKKQSIEGRK